MKKCGICKKEFKGIKYCSNKCAYQAIKIKSNKKYMENNTNCAQALVMTKINCDKEAWLRDRLVRLIILVQDIQQSNTLDKEMIELATEGAINGQALAILQVLNLEPEYVNLPKRTWWFSDTRRKNPNGLFGLSNPYNGLTTQEFNEKYDIGKGN